MNFLYLLTGTVLDTGGTDDKRPLPSNSLWYHRPVLTRPKESRWHNGIIRNFDQPEEGMKISEGRGNSSWSLKKKNHSVMWSEQKWNFSRGDNLITGGLIPGLGRSPGEGKGYPLQYSGLENPMDCIVHGVAKNQTGQSGFHFHFFLFR